MYVDIDGSRIYIQKQHIKRVLICLNQSLVGSIYCMVEVAAFDVAIVDEEKLLPTRFFSVFWLAYIALDAEMGSFFLTGDELILDSFPKNPHNALAKFAWKQVVGFQILLVQGKGNFWVGKGHPLEFIDDMSHFHGIGLQEIPSCRHIEKQVSHGHRSSYGYCYRFLLFDLGTFNMNQGTHLSFLGSGF